MLSGRTLRCSREELSGAVGKSSQEDRSALKLSGTLGSSQMLSVPILEGGAGGRGVAIQYPTTEPSRLFAGRRGACWCMLCRLVTS